MKIVHVVMNYYPSVGGTQWLFQNVSERLVKNYGDEVIVLTTDSYFGPEKKMFKKIIPSIENYNGVEIHRFSFARWFLPLVRIMMKVYGKLFNHTSEVLDDIVHGPNSFSLTKALKNVKADVVCACSSNYSFVDYAVWRKRTKTPKAFVYMGAIHFSENNNDDVLHKNKVRDIQASEYYIANTFFEKRQLAKFGVDENMIEVVGCGVDAEKYKKGNRSKIRSSFNIKDDETLMGFVGRHEPLKNINILIEAFQQLKKSNEKIKLIIAGASSWYTEQVKKLIAEANELSENIFLMCDISEEEKIDLFNAIDIFASASSDESFGIVFIEAWACKKPIVATDIGAINCVIANNEDGLLVEPLNATAMAEAFEKLISDNPLKEKLGNNGYEKMLKQYTWDVVTEKYRNIYIKAQQKFLTVS